METIKKKNLISPSQAPVMLPPLVTGVLRRVSSVLQKGSDLGTRLVARTGAFLSHLSRTPSTRGRSIGGAWQRAIDLVWLPHRTTLNRSGNRSDDTIAQSFSSPVQFSDRETTPPYAPDTAEEARPTEPAKTNKGISSSYRSPPSLRPDTTTPRRIIQTSVGPSVARVTPRQTHEQPGTPAPNTPSGRPDVTVRSITAETDGSGRETVDPPVSTQEVLETRHLLGKVQLTVNQNVGDTTGYKSPAGKKSTESYATPPVRRHQAQPAVDQATNEVRLTPELLGTLALPVAQTSTPQKVSPTNVESNTVQRSPAITYEAGSLIHGSSQLRVVAEETRQLSNNQQTQSQTETLAAANTATAISGSENKTIKIAGSPSHETTPTGEDPTLASTGKTMSIQRQEKRVDSLQPLTPDSPTVQPRVRDQVSRQPLAMTTVRPLLRPSRMGIAAQPLARVAKNAAHSTAKSIGTLLMRDAALTIPTPHESGGTPKRPRFITSLTDGSKTGETHLTVDTSQLEGHTDEIGLPAVSKADISTGLPSSYTALPEINHFNTPEVEPAGGTDNDRRPAQTVFRSTPYRDGAPLHNTVTSESGVTSRANSKDTQPNDGLAHHMQEKYSPEFHPVYLDTESLPVQKAEDTPNADHVSESPGAMEVPSERPDLNEIARHVYRIIRRRLAVERERTQGLG